MIQQVQPETGMTGDGRDPVCGIRLSEQHAIRFTYGRAILLFCGAGCLEHFRQHPDAYLRR
jgi:YHS domain-containing protein